MKLKYKKYDLQLKHPFRIAIYTRTSTPLVLVEIEHEGVVGFGECSMPQYLGENQETAFDFYDLVVQSRILENAKSIDIQVIMSELNVLRAGNTAAKAAIDIALHDLKGKLENKPVWQIVGSNPELMPVTSYTLGIDTPSVLRQKVAEAADFSVLKIKLGAENDREIIETIREVTDKPLYVDANQGWTDPQFALDMVFWLKECGVVLVEQPLPKHDLDGNARVTEGATIPIFADESCQRLEDLSRISGAFHGINIKLMKSTGLNEAQHMLAEARQRGLKTMIGCMSETSCGILAGAALAPQCDFADLDGPWLIANNPFATPILRGGKIQLSGFGGLGL